LTDLEQFRPSKLWKQMPPERRLQAADAFWQDEHSVEQQAEAVMAVAQRLKFRAKSAAALPLEKKAKHLAALTSISDTLAGRLLVSYHLTTQRLMMGRFLDVLQIAHENGLITQEDLKAPTPQSLDAAAREVATAFPREDVELYFATLVSQDPDTWEGLTEVLTKGSDEGF
jgi:hypothetical protein